MPFAFGPKSRAELTGVDARLVAVVEHALSISPVDFAVHDGLRTEAEQRAAVARGASRTMASLHRTGRAVDLVPYVGGSLRWSWPELYRIAEAMREAGIARGVALRWGGAWDVTLTDTVESAQDVSQGYAARRKAAGRSVFTDGPHFEVVG